MELGLAGKRVVITGGTRGIGRAIAEAFSNEGASVALCARNEAQVKHTVAALTKKGSSIYGQALDISDHTTLLSGLTTRRISSVALTLSLPTPARLVLAPLRTIGKPGTRWT